MRFAALVLLFLPMNLLWGMLEGSPSEVGKLSEQFGTLRDCAVLLQPWLFVLIPGLAVFPEAMIQILIRCRFQGAVLPIVVMSSLVSACIYYWAFRLLSHIPLLRRFSRRVSQFVPIVGCALLFIGYSSVCIYVAMHRVSFRYSPS
jgi:hypothetical protein